MNKVIYRTEFFLTIIFLLQMVFFAINKNYLNWLSEKIPGYLFWLSFGLLSGFHICKYEFKKWIKEQNENMNNIGKQKMPSKHSIN